MAGWSKRVDGSGIESFRKPETGPDPKQVVKPEVVDYGDAKLLFIEILAQFFKEVTGLLCYRPLPPMLGNGKSVDLFKLYLVVREKGGYERVCVNGSWSLVAEDCGFDSGYGMGLKLVYVKYLDALERWMLRLKKKGSSNGVINSDVRKCDLGSGLGLDQAGVPVDVELDLKEILMKIADEKAYDCENRSVNGVEARGFDDLYECTETFDGKRNLDHSAVTVKDIDENRSVNVEQLHDVVEARDFDGLNECTETFDGKTKLDHSAVTVKVIDENRSVNGEQLRDGVEARDFDGLNECTETFDGKRNLDRNAFTVNDIDENRSVNYDEEHLMCVSGRESVKEDCISRKRKRESYLDLVRWVGKVAKDPCDPAIGSLPERSKWEDYGDEVVWKQVLLVRDEMLLEKNVDTCAQYSAWQIKQKMHPSMYDDTSGPGRVRCSQRVLSAKDSLKKMRALLFSVSSSSSPHSDKDQVDGPTDSSAESAVGFWWKQRRKRIPIGPEFQADIPECIEVIYESDSKWLGTETWPRDKQGKNRMLIDKRDPIGKGRQDICGCQSPGSYDCIKFHLFEKRKKIEIELGSAYYQWKFDSMGEEVALCWSREEEGKFQDIVKSNRLTEDKSFWNEIFKFFPNRSRESLVSYYFNVFLLRRRGDQNRTNVSDFDSDDDESEYGPRFKCFGRDAKFSIFCSPKKSTSGSEVVHES
ncbi:PREDICTED: AT-rich interactive domain-containing protein 1-like [Nicotiana attenuata]|uniref:At-rich interactive domain-containing protein 1 n=1 Tax=Nicotiana attenuata TaxID=49451 RepID=A0A314KWL3_NICAT|nr:PREDICTED: AT-rich interactive domain-containing protein 1-like [Nicotiana attenuata]OIT33159.1 at-rich interactive domain-containing protein 1 [Nicotiana attenuata]